MRSQQSVLDTSVLAPPHHCARALPHSSTASFLSPLPSRDALAALCVEQVVPAGGFSLRVECFPLTFAQEREKAFVDAPLGPRSGEWLFGPRNNHRFVIVLIDTCLQLTSKYTNANAKFRCSSANVIEQRHILGSCLPRGRKTVSRKATSLLLSPTNDRLFNSVCRSLQSR